MRNAIGDRRAEFLTSDQHLIQLLDDPALEWTQLSLLRAQLKRVLARSEFYQIKLKDVPDVDAIRSLKDFSQLPFTHKEELRGSQDERPPFGLHLCASPSELIRISSTSGTTGRPLYYATTPDDKHTVWRSWHHIYRAAGIGPQDRTLYGFAMGGPYGGLYGAEAFEEMGIQCIPVGSDQSSDRFIQLLCDLKPTVLTCVSNFPMRLVQQLRQRGFDPRGIGLRMLLLGGEPVSPVRAAIEEDWGVEVFEMMGAGETGMIWGECPHRNGMHYLSKDLVLVEFIDPDTLEAVRPAPGLTAELVYTHLRREACPLVRYRTRDLVTVSGMDCECGRRGPRVTCVGRTDDMLKVRGMNIFPSAIADLLASFGKPVTDNFRIVLQGGERKFSRPLSLVIGIETSIQSADERARLQEKLSDYLRSNLNVRTEVKLIASSELGDALRGGLGRRDYFVDARAE